MKTSDLKKILEINNVNKSSYSIGRKKEDRCCIKKKGLFVKYWQVFDVERDVCQNLTNFDNEDDACENFLKRLGISINKDTKWAYYDFSTSETQTKNNKNTQNTL